MPLRPALRVSSLLFIAACSASSAAANGSDSGASATSCESAIPASQTLSEPCCPAWGPDACGADLFCAAFDGRTQATCYPIYSRLPGQTCTDAMQCTSAGCSSAGTCEALPGQSCSASPGCGPGLVGTTPYYCGTQGNQSICLPCAPGSVDPACSSSPAGGSDGGASAPTSGQIANLCAVFDAGAACTQCCTVDLAGATTYATGILACVCGSGAGCASACADEICAGRPVTTGDACATCVNGTSTSSCTMNVVGSCTSDPTCDAFLACEQKSCF